MNILKAYPRRRSRSHMALELFTQSGRKYTQAPIPVLMSEQQQTSPIFTFQGPIYSVRVALRAYPLRPFCVPANSFGIRALHAGPESHLTLSKYFTNVLLVIRKFVWASCVIYLSLEVLLTANTIWRQSGKKQCPDIENCKPYLLKRPCRPVSFL